MKASNPAQAGTHLKNTLAFGGTGSVGAQLVYLERHQVHTHARSSSPAGSEARQRAVMCEYAPTLG